MVERLVGNQRLPSPASSAPEPTCVAVHLKAPAVRNRVTDYAILGRLGGCGGRGIGLMVHVLVNARRGSWALARFSIALALLLGGVSMLSYPGGTVLDDSTRGYSLTHNFLSDLGSTVAYSGASNGTGAAFMGAGLLIMVLVLASSVVATVRLLSAVSRARLLARLAAVAGVLVCAGFLGVALSPEDRAMHLHMVSSMVAFRSFPVTAALLAIATMRDGRFRARATAGWMMLTVVLVGLIAMTHLGPTVATEHGLMVQVVTQKIMAATVLGVLWLESREAEIAGASGIAPRE